LPGKEHTVPAAMNIALRMVILPMALIAGMVFLIALAIEMMEYHAAKSADRLRGILIESGSVDHRP